MTLENSFLSGSFFMFFRVTTCVFKSLCTAKIYSREARKHSEMAQLRPFDVFEIQTAIDDYERRHPRFATPSAEVALAWRLGWRGRERAREQKLPRKLKRQRTRFEGEVGLLRWAYEGFLVWWLVR
jgi:hypothetical protein